MNGHQFLLDANEVSVFRSRNGEDVVVNHVTGSVGYTGSRSVENLAATGLFDAIIVETEDGFSQLGAMRSFVSRDLGLEERNVARWVLDGFPE